MLKFSVTRDDQLDDIIITEDTSLYLNLENCNKDINIDVMENMCLEVFELDINTKNKIKYNIRANSSVIVNKIGRDNSDITNITLSGENASLKYCTSILNYKDNIYKFRVDHLSDNTSSYVLNHGVNFENTELNILVDSYVKKGLKGCKAEQDTKIIDLGNGKNLITPNLLIDAEDIEAEHAAYIGKFKPEVVFYLQSRGIPLKEVDELLTKGFLLNKMILTGREEEDFNKFIEDNYK